MDEQTEISKLQLSEKEEEFIGQCWDGVQDLGKLSMDGLGTLCETLGITMDVINVALTDLGSEDLTLDCDDFMLLMGRMLRSGALTLPQAANADASPSLGAAGSQKETAEETSDPNEMSKIELTEREEDFIGQCWDGVKQSDRLDMEGLHALSETLGIDSEVINMAVTGLGSADCTMDRGEFMLLMGRMLRSGALKLPPEPERDEEDTEDTKVPTTGGGSWMSALSAQEATSAPPSKTAAAGNAAWMATMAGGAQDVEETAPSKPKAQGGMAWMATMTAEGEDVDETLEPAAAKSGMAWMASMAGEDVDEAEGQEPPAAKAGMAAWMASMAVDDGEDVDLPEAAPTGAGGGAAAWMASMVPAEEESEKAVKPVSNTSGMSAWMATMAGPEDEDN